MEKCLVRYVLAVRRQRNITKTLMVMKISSVLMLIFALHASAKTVSQTVTLKGNNLSIQQVFAAIEKQTNYSVFYNKALLKDAKPVSVDVKKMPLEDFLKMELKDQPFHFIIESQNIIIRRKNIPESKAGPALKNFLPDSPVAGIIRDAEGKPIAGASITVKGTSRGAISDQNGSFTIEVKAGEKLLISSIGFRTKEIIVPSGAGSLSITLEQNSSVLDEVQYIAYGNTSRRLNTGNVTTVKAADIEKQPVSNPLAALQGRVPGLIITQTSGVPGSSFKVQLRGRTAIDREITDDQPLFVIDGVPAAQNNGFLNQLTSALGLPTNSSTASTVGGLSPFNSINTQDIESIEVLKDADATAIYGSRGANGVIMITTKKGKAGKSTVFMNMYTGISKVSRTMDMMDTKQYVSMRKEAFLNDNVAMTKDKAFDLLVWDTTRYTDFKKLLIGGTAKTTDIQAGISGGNAQTQFRLASSYHRETTVYPGNWASTRGTVDANLQHQSADQRFRLVFSAGYSLNNALLPTQDVAGDINAIPNIRVYDDEGNLAWNEGGYSWTNPLAWMYNSYEVKTDNLQSNLQLQYRILPGLVLRNSFGFNSIRTDEDKTTAIASRNPASIRSGNAYFANNLFKSWILEPQLDYRKRWGQGELQLLAGASIQQQRTYSTSITGSGYSSDDLLHSLAGANKISASNASSQYKYAAAFARALYNFRNKYLLNLSARRDGSSRFGPGRQFANFGSIGAAWIFSEENFMEAANSVLSFGKLRGSYGTTGNDKISNYQYLDTYQSATTLAYQDSSTLTPSKLFNPDYRWEATRKFELGLDLGLYKDRILVALAWYRNISSNQLINYSLPNTAGFLGVVANFPAKVRNSGVELTITSTNIRNENWQWTTSANLTIPKTVLVSFPGLENSSYYFAYKEGSPLNLIYRYRYLGVDPATGDYLAEDVNNDGKLSIRDDYQVLGDLDPRFFGGIQNNLTFRSWELSFFFEFRKQTGANWLAWQFSKPGAYGNMPVNALDRWQKPGDIALVRKYTQSSSNPTVPLFADMTNTATDGSYSDASYIRLRNVSISYNFPAEGLRKIKIQGLRLYLLAQNLLTISGYKGADPEIQSLRALPSLQTITAGLQINL